MPQSFLGAPDSPRARRNGVLASLTAFSCWGLFPLYFKALQARPPEVLVHRILWSALFLLAVSAGQRRWAWLGGVLRSPRLLFGSLLSAALLSVNWLIYIWAVSEGRVVDASLGYFITPLLSVVFGVVLLGEALRPLQWLALGVAALGVLWLTVQRARRCSVSPGLGHPGKRQRASELPCGIRVRSQIAPKRQFVPWRRRVGLFRPVTGHRSSLG
jgi:chloramphenicol-sensitive protein RarD